MSDLSKRHKGIDNFSDDIRVIDSNSQFAGFPSCTVLSNHYEVRVDPLDISTMISYGSSRELQNDIWSPKPQYLSSTHNLLCGVSLAHDLRLLVQIARPNRYVKSILCN